MDKFLKIAVDGLLVKLLKAAAIAFIALLSMLIAFVQLSDLFNNLPEFENPILSFLNVLLMLCVCRAMMNAKKSRMAVAIAFVILSYPCVCIVLDVLYYTRNGFSILINSENAIRQICRIFIVSALALMPLICVCVRPIIRKHAEG